LHDPPKFTQIDIFGQKICHLATLPPNYAHFYEWFDGAP
jgi:hypothetical protein